jgi:hypothetical protein
VQTGLSETIDLGSYLHRIDEQGHHGQWVTREGCLDYESARKCHHPYPDRGGLDAALPSVRFSGELASLYLYLSCPSLPSRSPSNHSIIVARPLTVGTTPTSNPLPLAAALHLRSCASDLITGMCGGVVVDSARLGRLARRDIPIVLVSITKG